MSSHKKNQVSNPKNGFKNHKGRITPLVSMTTTKIV